MKQIHNKTLFAFAAATVLLLCGCMKEPAEQTLGEGVQLCLSIDGQQRPAAGAATRATAVNESAVNDLWVLQFQMTAGSTTEGTLVKKVYIAPISDIIKIKKPISGNNMMLYLVANTGNSSLFSSTADGTTLAAVKATTLEVTATDGKNFPAPTCANLPMVGQSANHAFPYENVVAVVLRRTAAKIVLTVKNQLKVDYPQLTVTSVQLKNVAKVYSTQIVNAAYSPGTSGDNFTHCTAIAGDITAAGTTSTYYLAPNARGIGTATRARLKSDATAASGQGAFCTYLEILGTAKASAADTQPLGVRYRLYLGGNNTNDYNLYSNTAYKVDVELAGINLDDARLAITTDKFDLIQGPTEGDHQDDIIGWNPPPLSPVLMYYGDAAHNGGVTTGLQGFTKSSYNSLTVGSNGTAYSTYIAAYAGEKPHYRLEVAPANERTSAGSEVMNWDTAYNSCKSKTDFGGSWRMPRLSEAWLMHLNRATLNALPGFIALSNDFWSGTEYYISDNAWFVGVSSSFATYYYKTYANSVRCVRELPPLPAPMYYGDAANNGGVTTELQGSTTSSYNGYTNNDNNAGTNGGIHTSAAAAYANEKPYYKLEVLLTDEPLDPWSRLYNACKFKTDFGGGWRLPRLSEMWLMYLNRASLNATPGFTALLAGGIYWSGTNGRGTNGGSGTNLAWFVKFTLGTTENYFKTANANARCVREVH